MNTNELVSDTVNKVGFYRSNYRWLANVSGIVVLVFLCFACYVLRIAWRPHRTYSIITTLDGRLIVPQNSYFRTARL